MIGVEYTKLLRRLTLLGVFVVTELGELRLLTNCRIITIIIYCHALVKYNYMFSHFDTITHRYATRAGGQTDRRTDLLH